MLGMNEIIPCFPDFLEDFKDKTCFQEVQKLFHKKGNNLVYIYIGLVFLIVYGPSNVSRNQRIVSNHGQILLILITSGKDIPGQHLAHSRNECYFTS